jgi:hypothetical protein
MLPRSKWHASLGIKPYAKVRHLRNIQDAARKTRRRRPCAVRRRSSQVAGAAELGTEQSCAQKQSGDCQGPRRRFIDRPVGGALWLTCLQATAPPAGAVSSEASFVLKMTIGFGIPRRFLCWWLVVVTGVGDASFFRQEF